MFYLFRFVYRNGLVIREVRNPPGRVKYRNICMFCLNEILNFLCCILVPFSFDDIHCSFILFSYFYELHFVITFHYHFCKCYYFHLHPLLPSSCFVCLSPIACLYTLFFFISYFFSLLLLAILLAYFFL